MSITKAYEEVVDFIAAGSDSASVAAFRPSETAELEHHLQMEHLMRLAKARARQLLAAK